MEFDFSDIFFGDLDCMLCMIHRSGGSLPSSFMVVDLSRQFGRVLMNETESDQRFITCRQNWYDSARGLLFCANMITGLVALLVTY